MIANIPRKRKMLCSQRCVPLLVVVLKLLPAEALLPNEGAETFHHRDLDRSSGAHASPAAEEGAIGQAHARAVAMAGAWQAGGAAAGRVEAGDRFAGAVEHFARGRGGEAAEREEREVAVAEAEF